MEVKYFSSSWNDIKNSPGWFGKVCLLGLINLIPIFGNIVTYGYAWGWARDIAWDVHRPMPKNIFGNEDGKLYSRGFFAFLAFFICGVIYAVLRSLWPNNDLYGLLIFVLLIGLCLLADVAIIRESIYARYSAGFQINKVWAMAMHDWKGLLRILGMLAIIACIFVLALIALSMVIVTILVAVSFAGIGSVLDASEINNLMMFGDFGMSDGDITQLVLALLPAVGIGIVLFLALFYVISCAGVWMRLMEVRAVGYWARQFEVDKWQGQDDPMPFERAKQAAAPVQTVPPVAADQSAPNAVVPQAMTYGDPAPMEAAVLVVDQDTAPFAESSLEAPVAVVSEQASAGTVEAPLANAVAPVASPVSVPQASDEAPVAAPAPAPQAFVADKTSTEHAATIEVNNEPSSPVAPASSEETSE